MRKNVKTLKKNFDNAIMLEWRKVLQIEMLILYELADYTPQGLSEFADSFYSYLEDAIRHTKELDAMLEDFKKATGLHLDEVKLEGTAVTKAIKTTDALCIQIGAFILWYVGEWESREIRKFAYTCWDFLGDYSTIAPRIRIMERMTGIKVENRFKRLAH